MKERLRANHIYGLRHKPIKDIKIGIIGLGNRGIATLKRYMQLQLTNFEIVALADIESDNVNAALTILTEHNKARPATYFGENNWRELCENQTINLVIICTDWLSHTKIALYAMEQLKHVAIEVPAAITVDECWQLVLTAERTKMHCTMLENCCYDPFSLNVLNLVRKGKLGEINHVEGAYIHDLRSYYFKSQTEGGTYKNWSLDYCLKHTGNPYPTHGLGPLAKIIGLNDTDYMTSLVSMSSKQGGFNTFAKSKYGPNSIEAKMEFKMGDMNTTLIKTAKGKTILLQYSISLPQPYNRLFTICGTKGFAQKYPNETIQIENDSEGIIKQKQILQHPFVTNIATHAEKLGIENAMNYMMDYRLIYCLQNGLPMDISIYDAVQWSCIAELSEKSVLNNSISIEIPTFLFTE